EGVDVVLRARKPCYARVDETRLCQVLLNLLKNAAHAVRGRPEARIEVDAEPVLDRVLIRVADNGPGIGDDVARRLFEPWFTTRVEGTGLGLALCRQYVAEMAGTIELVNSSAMGSVFEIDLPQVAAPDTGRPTLVPDGERRMARVLVLDDSALIRRAIERALAPQHEVQVAASPADALDRLRERRYDVVFVDLHLAGSTGIAFYEQASLKHRDRIGDVVFLSGAFGEADLAYLEQNGLAWVRKPFGAEELRHLVTELTARR
ncbi:MAG: ATP-binding protein, partial [Myxococcota bacterium]